jgi:hypothetical protein
MKCYPRSSDWAANAGSNTPARATPTRLQSYSFALQILATLVLTACDGQRTHWQVRAAPEPNELRKFLPFRGQFACVAVN